MRAELGKMTLDRTFEEREALNANIVEAINSASAEWGVLCRRYEIRPSLVGPCVLCCFDCLFCLKKWQGGGVDFILRPSDPWIRLLSFTAGA